MATTAPATAEPPSPTTRNCGTMPVHERLLRTDPEYRRLRIVSENNHFAFRLHRGVMARTGVTRIPVVVHVVFRTAAQNVSDAQVKSQIEVLNRDFRKTNVDLNRIPVPFKPLATDARIEFVLADKDPLGGASTGITRTSTTQTSFIDDDKVKRVSSGGADAWPRDKYLNIWVCQLGGGLLGYAQFPGGGAATDGVVVTHTAFGTQGTAAAPFNLGRTATHEVGHWLNLRHIWGDDGNGCNGDDFVADTPNQGDENTGKPVFPQLSCNNGPHGDMFMNYMDYTDDDSMFMFTAGQVERMQACLDGDRAGIGTQTGATLASVDTMPATDQVTMKFRDDHPPTLKFRDDNQPTIKFRDDTPPTLKFREDVPPTIKFRDDNPVTLKFREDTPPTFKFREDVKQPMLDKPPQADMGTGFGNDQFPFGPGPFFNPGFGGRGGVPFVLSTPHHSMAWTRSFPQAAQAEMQALAEQINELQSLLTQYAQGDAAGQLSDEDRAQADALNEELEALSAEYQRHIGS